MKKICAAILAMLLVLGVFTACSGAKDEVNPEILGVKDAAAVEQGKCPFAYSWQKDIRGYRAFKIPTVTFYLWYTNCHGVPGV